jgi:phage terminase small subunit
MNTKELNAKQKRFVAEYLIDLNASAAYKRSGYKATGKSADSAGARLLSDVKVKAAIDAAQAERLERTIISQDYVLAKIQEVIERCSAQGVAYEPGAVLKGTELLGRHLKMFTDKFDHSGAVSVQIVRFGKDKEPT